MVCAICLKPILDADPAPYGANHDLVDGKVACLPCWGRHEDEKALRNLQLS